VSAIHIAKAAGARGTATDISEEKLSMARRLGADVVLNASEDGTTQRIYDETQGGADVSVDALAIKETCLNAIASLRKRGRHLQLELPTESGHVAPSRFQSMISLERN
jgi:D-arabinose 1-dehydrogenase-like Zn-dependent alcohol dehydrogenase